MGRMGTLGKGTIFLLHIMQAASGAHQAISPKAMEGVLAQEQIGRGVKLITHV
jgi:hypothetical protein